LRKRRFRGPPTEKKGGEKERGESLFLVNKKKEEGEKSDIGY